MKTREVGRKIETKKKVINNNNTRFATYDPPF
jgi:hypothetical protein